MGPSGSRIEQPTLIYSVQIGVDKGGERSGFKSLVPPLDVFSKREITEDSTMARKNFPDGNLPPNYYLMVVILVSALIIGMSLVVSLIAALDYFIISPLWRLPPRWAVPRILIEVVVGLRFAQFLYLQWALKPTQQKPQSDITPDEK